MANGVRDSGNISMTVCNLCGTFENLMLCKGCMCAWYCSKEHQTLHWQEHKPICRKKRAELKDSSNVSPEFGTSRSVRGIAHTHIGGRDKRKDSSVITFPGQHQPACPPEAVHVLKQVHNNTFASPFDNYQEESGATRAAFIESTDADSLVVLPAEGSAESYILECDASALNPSPTVSGSANNNDIMPPSNTVVDTKQTYLAVLESRNKSFGEYVVRCMNKFGVCVIDDFLGETKGSEIFQEVKNIQKLGLFKRGQLVNSSTTGGPTNSTKPIRGDFIHWIDGSEKYSKNIKLLVSTMDAVILHCAGQLGQYNINGRTKAMVACYPGNSSGYVRHVDNPNGDGRCVTCIYYLNKNWNGKADGGLLQIFPENQNRMASIEPKFDRLLFFWSDRRNPHEVQPCIRTRYAITIWYYDEDERERAVKRFKADKTSMSLFPEHGKPSPLMSDQCSK
ncbi:hypothetical protein ScPMuIL_014225 [Solemya velum]